MTKLKLIAVAVLCAMPTGYRRAGFALSQGDNSPLEVNQEQFIALEADKNLTVTMLTDDLAERSPDDIINTGESHTLLLDENTALKKQVAALTTLCEGQEKNIKQLEDELAKGLVGTHEDTLADLAGVGERTFGFDCTSAPEELHGFIAEIDELNKEAPLTKKPNCDLLTITVDDNSVTPTGAQRDAAWQWYEDNVLVATADEAKA